MLSGTRTPDTRGVAPVIGVVLLIGITVILAATVAAFAFGLGQESTQGQVPAVALSTDYDTGGSGDELTFSHDSGEVVDVASLYVTIEGASCGNADPNGRHDVSDILSSSMTEFSSGHQITVDEGTVGNALSVSNCDDFDLDGATVRLSCEAGMGSSTTVRTWNGPE